MDMQLAEGDWEAAVNDLSWILDDSSVFSIIHQNYLLLYH